VRRFATDTPARINALYVKSRCTADPVGARDTFAFYVQDVIDVAPGNACVRRLRVRTRGRKHHVARSADVATRARVLPSIRVAA
jgi:hypothetical protein